MIFLTANIDFLLIMLGFVAVVMLGIDMAKARNLISRVDECLCNHMKRSDLNIDLNTTAISLIKDQFNDLQKQVNGAFENGAKTKNQILSEINQQQSLYITKSAYEGLLKLQKQQSVEIEALKHRANYWEKETININKLIKSKPILPSPRAITARKAKANGRGTRYVSR